MIVTLCSGSAAGQHRRDDRVSRLVIRGVPLLAVGHHHRLPLDAHDDLVLRVLEVDHLDFLLVVARGVQRGLVDEVGEVGAGESRRAARDDAEVDVLGERDVARVDARGCLRGP